MFTPSNMPKTMPKGVAARLKPWNEPLDMNLHVTSEGEPRVPFGLHVQSTPKPQPKLGCTTFSQFSLLPSELQLHILSFCDSPTLFRLMQISATRSQAKKFFWSDPTILYCVSGLWLREHGYPGDVHYDLDFLANVEHVNVWFDETITDWWGAGKVRKPGDMRNLFISRLKMWSQRPSHPTAALMEYQVTRFWQKLREVCPRVTHVLLTEFPREWVNHYTQHQWIGMLLRRCPADINVTMSVREAGLPTSPNVDPQEKQHLYRLRYKTLDKPVEFEKWDLEPIEWTPRFVLVPPHAFRGPVGAFLRSLFRYNRNAMQASATRPLLIDAVERQHFHGKCEPFECSVPGCAARFRVPGAYYAHARQMRHDMHTDPPEQWEALFEQRSQRLAQLEEEEFWDPYDLDIEESGAIAERMERSRQHHEELFLNPALFDKREQEVKQAFFDQLRNDPLYLSSGFLITLELSEKHKIFDPFLEKLKEVREKKSDFSFRATSGKLDPMML